MPDAQDIADRINRLVPSDLAADVLAAVEALGGEAQRFEIIDRALELGDWSDAELAVVSRYAGAARTYHLRTLADYAVTLSKERGDLVEGGSPGRWRLPRRPRSAIRPHDHDRVFIASVGVAEAPVDDDWDASQQTYLWFSTHSRQVSTGDHIFVLGAGRQSAVLGLFESLSTGTTQDNPHPADPVRWSWSIQARPLASVPPPEARSVDPLIAPRGAPQLVRDAGSRRTLYEAVRGYEVQTGERSSGSADGDSPGTAGRGQVRRPRPFDPDHAPSPASPTSEILRREEADVLQEKARQAHHELLVRLQAALESAGWSEIEEIPAAIDLRGQHPNGGMVIFEAKTLRDNEISQARSGLAQLLEYRLDYGQPDNDICLVVDRELSEHRVALLERLGVGVLLAGESELRPLNDQAPAVD